MRRLKRLLAQVGLGLIMQILVPVSVLAMCIGFSIPSRPLTPADNTKTLVVYQNGIQHLIVQPEFNGNVSDFALVMPAPAEPTVSSAPEDLFVRLEDFTNPLSGTRGLGTLENAALSADGVGSSSREVRVLDRSNVGQYTATTLAANDTQLLQEWLEDNGYEVGDLAIEVLDYYTQTNGFFVALKVNMSQVTGTSTKLNPIDISYPTNEPRIPTRLLAGMPQTFSYVVYTLAPEPYVVPGGDVQYLKQLSLSDVISGDGKILLGYNAHNQWLVRNKIDVNPTLAKADQPLHRVAGVGSNFVSTFQIRQNVEVEQLVPDSGIVQRCVPEVSSPSLDDTINASGPAGPGFEEITTGRSTFRSSTVQRTGIDPTLCRDSYNFEQAIGAPLTNAGFPILASFKIVVVTLTLLFVAWRVMLVRKGGMSRLIPRPDRSVATFTRTVERRTGSKLFGGSQKVKPSVLGYRNVAIWSVASVAWYQFGWFLTNRDVADSLALLLLIPTLVALGLWTAFGLFIQPTAIQVRKGWRPTIRYFVSVIIGLLITLAIAVAVNWFLNQVVDTGF